MIWIVHDAEGNVENFHPEKTITLSTEAQAAEVDNVISRGWKFSIELNVIISYICFEAWRWKHDGDRQLSIVTHVKQGM
jgi:hypothetical protein